MVFKLKKQILVIAYALILIILIILKPAQFSFLDSSLILQLITIFFLLVVIHLFSNERKNWFRVDIIFIIGFFAVHLQWPLMHGVSEIIPKKYNDIFPDIKLMNYSAWVATIAMLFFLLGYNVFSFNKVKRRLDMIFIYDKLKYFVIISYVIFLAFAGKDFLTGQVYRGLGEGGTAGAGISKYFFIFFQIGLKVLTMIVIYNNRFNYKGNLVRWFLSFDKQYLTVAISYILIFLLIGDRGGPLALLLTIVIFTGLMVRQFSLKELLLMAFVGGMALMLIGLGRSKASGLSILNEGINDLEYEQGVYQPTLELANSYRTFNRAILHTSNKSDYSYGSLWVSDLLSPIPFAQSFYLKLSNKELYEISSSKLITYLVYGKNPPSGEGTSLLGDIYLNFGSYGIMFFMFLFGVFFKKIADSIRNLDSVLWLTMASVFVGYALYYSRTSLFFPFREVCWSVLFMSLFVTKRKI
jgi:cbb3-type cytochrome oxidase subunit 3